MGTKAKPHRKKREKRKKARSLWPYIAALLMVGILAARDYIPSGFVSKMAEWAGMVAERAEVLAEQAGELADQAAQLFGKLELPAFFHSGGQDQSNAVDLGSIPPYAGNAWVEVNDNIPSFTAEEVTTAVFEEYSPLDALGRCGAAYANICLELMPTEKREDIGSVKPSGWHLAKYDCVDGKYLYNRCHLIGFQLAGENANEKNLITGTRYLNVTGMLPFENQVTDYVKETGNHVLYRVAPVFEGENLVADGVHMEGYSVEDEGEGICFNIFAYNVQPGVEIDYATGNSWESDPA